MKKNIILFILMLVVLQKMQAQNIAISATGATPEESAILDVSSTSKGLLIPRMTLAEKNAITSPATGLMIYQTDAPAGFCYFDGTSWNQIGATAPTPGSFNFSFKGTIAQGFNANVATKVNFPTQNYLNNVAFANSIFTAPSSGIYSFSVNLNIYGNAATSASVGFYVNNVARSTSTFNIINAVFQNIGYTDNLSLTSGDQVTVKTQPLLYISCFALNFAGYKIN